MGDIRFLGRARGGRCVYCHDSLSGAVQTCPECSATWHHDCGEGARRCPTTGCSGPAPGAASRPGRERTRRAPVPTARPEDLSVDRARPGLGARFGPYSRLASSALGHLLGAAVATGVLLWPVLDWASFWRFCRDGERHPNPAPLAALGAIVVVGVALLLLYGMCRWLTQIPAVLREVSSLLDDTRPTAMRLTVYTEGSGKGTKWFARLVGGEDSLTIPLDGLLPPGWLTRKTTYEEHPVLVYGLPPPGPYVIEFRDGALALVHPYS